jgi:hypothetical protein
MPLGTNGLGPVCISVLTAGFVYPSHCTPSLAHLLHTGFLSSHFTRRVLHQSVCHLSPKFNNILACQTSRLHLWAPLVFLLPSFAVSLVESLFLTFPWPSLNPFASVAILQSLEFCLCSLIIQTLNVPIRRRSFAVEDDVYLCMKRTASYN